MISLLAALAVLGAPTAPSDPPVVRITEADRPALRLWMSNERRYREGDPARLQVDAEVDGYLLVVNYDTDGRLRILFPLEPRDDGRVRAGRRYEVRDESGRGAFIAGGDGTGLIFSAISQDPWRFDEIVLADRWDFTRLEIDRRSTNPEQDITDQVQRLAGPGGFDYDVMGYRVYGQTRYTSDSYYPRSVYIYDDYLYCNNWSWRYNGCRRWPYDGGWSIGFGYGYDPFYYGYGRSPYGYGYGNGYGGYFPYGGGYYPYRPLIPGQVPSAGPRPRGYPVRPPTQNANAGGSPGFGSGVVGAGRSPGSVPPINWRARPAARPVNGPTVVSRGGSGGTPVFSPPARRARPDNDVYPVGGGGRNANDRGRDEPRSYNPPAARSEPRRDPPSSPPPARAEPSHSSGGSGGGHSAPPSGGSRPRRPRG